eukprot:TRINITY_DN14918_c0_g1_i1.p1 TRINITY_DN14918_c0_g1~~TRINITY_DN14918_c0_g1_i1.p1  ORF type:complete len:311 (+),score=48.49 TRINITY_DN14918_c0_g1_i1:157-1089(+)
MAVFLPLEFSCYAVEYSPFSGGRLAVSAAQHFGIVGNGKQYILERDVKSGALVLVNQFDSVDGLYDCAWSEANENHLVAGSGDGSIKLWDVFGTNRPLQSFEEHTQEVHSVDWNLVYKDTFLSGSWDCDIKLWSPERRTSVGTYREHSKCVYSVAWSPLLPDVFASAAGDGTLKIWDVKAPSSSRTLFAHDYEILSCDWNKYNEHVLVSGSVDKTVKLWDIRSPHRELITLRGHDYAVRNVKCSPHSEDVIASASYDMSIVLWNLGKPDDPFVRRYSHHSEFVIGIDFNSFVDGELASCSWDDTVHVFPT